MTLFLCLLSSVLLILSHPPFDIWILAWFGLVPMMMALNNAGTPPGRGSLPKAFGIGYLCGMIFFTGTLYWFVHVTLPGAVLVVLYLSTYFGLFALGVVFFRSRRRTCPALAGDPASVRDLFLIPSIWVALEFIRSKLFTGFDWVSLGHSQYKVLPLIQIADVTGVFGISFLVVMVNVFIKGMYARVSRGVPIPTSREDAPAKKIIVVSGCLLLSLCYGFFRLSSPSTHEGPSLKVAAVQANISQEMKWQPSQWPDILNQYKDLTKQTMEHQPDLVIWPETSFPGYIWESPEVFEELKSFVAGLQVPLLFGAVTKLGDDYYNSAILISGEGKVVQQHNKLQLVPFGEYIPLRNYFPFLSKIVPIEDFTPGDQRTLFPIVIASERSERLPAGEAGSNLPLKGIASSPAAPRNDNFDKNLSVLICFEDTVAGVARGLVQAGAQLLVNITNDAWFLDTKAPLLHLQSAVFRTIENRRGLIRVANTGVSCFIDKFGRISSPVRGSRKKMTYVAGYSVEDVAFSEDKTFYTKFGDVFTSLCFGCILLGIIKR